MQQCAQCSRGAAAAVAFSSATRLIHALELPWTFAAAAIPSNNGANNKQHRHSRHVKAIRSGDRRRGFHHQSSSSSSLQSAESIPSPFDSSHASTSGGLARKKEKHASTTQQKHHNARSRHGGTSQRSLSTSTKHQREEPTTQAKFIDPSDLPSASPSKSTSTPGNDQSPAGSAAVNKSDHVHNTTTTGHASNEANRDTGSTSGPIPSQSSHNAAKSKNKANANSHLQYLNEEVITSSNASSERPLKDEINTLLAYPTLYDPIRKPRFPMVLCHGLYGFDTWGLELLPALK